MNEVCTWPYMCLCPTFQHELCNMTGNPHSDLFPNNNNTLEVDIYKGVCVVMCICVWSHFQLWVFKRKHMDSHLDLNFLFFIHVWTYASLCMCVSPGSGPGLFLWPCSSLHLGHWYPGSRTELHYDRNLLRPVCYGGMNPWGPFQKAGFKLGCQNLQCPTQSFQVQNTC